MSGPVVQAIIACDSRGRDFRDFPLIDKYGYNSHIILRRGACIKDIENDLVILLDGLCRKDIFIVYIAAGICEITKKIHHQNGHELDLRNSNSLLENLISCKQTIKNTFDKCIVNIATIPTINLAQAIRYNIDQGKLISSRFTEEEIKEKQARLNEIVKFTNEGILKENRERQELPGFGQIRLGNLFLHQDIEKTELKKRGGRKIHRTRIPLTALVDGVHANKDITLKWYRALHFNFMKLYDALESCQELNITNYLDTQKK
jgi:hypothetical protein